MPPGSSPVQNMSLPRRDRRPLLLMGLALLLCAWGLMWQLPNAFDPAQDSVVPIGELAQRGFGFEQITAGRYPPFHFMLLQAAFVPARAFLAAVPEAAANRKMVATTFIFTARLISLIMTLGTVWLVYRIGQRLWDKTAGLAAGLVLVLSPVTLYYAKNANLDAPMLFWLAAALLMYVRVFQEDRARDYAWLGLFSALTVCTKDQAYGFILLMPFPVAAMLWRRRHEKNGGAKAWRKLLLGFAAFAIPFVLIHNILFDFAGFIHHVETIRGPGSQPWRECSPNLLGQLRLLVESFLRLMDAWTPAGILLAGIGVAVALRPGAGRAARMALLVPAISYHLSFIAPIGYVYPRFMLPTLLTLAPFAGFGAVRLWHARRVAGPALAIAALAWIGLAGLTVDYVMANSPRYQAQKWIEECARQTPALEGVYYLGEMRDMPRFNDPLKVTEVKPDIDVPDSAMLENEREKLARIPPSNLLVLSLEAEHPALGGGSLRLASVLRRHLGEWGLYPGRRTQDSIYADLLSGRLGFREVARFRSPVARWTPEVTESVNRTIIIMRGDVTPAF